MTETSNPGAGTGSADATVGLVCQAARSLSATAITLTQCLQHFVNLHEVPCESIEHQLGAKQPPSGPTAQRAVAA